MQVHDSFCQVIRMASARRQEISSNVHFVVCIRHLETSVTARDCLLPIVPNSTASRNIVIAPNIEYPTIHKDRPACLQKITHNRQSAAIQIRGSCGMFQISIRRQIVGIDGHIPDCRVACNRDIVLHDHFADTAFAVFKVNKVRRCVGHGQIQRGTERDRFIILLRPILFQVSIQVQGTTGNVH